MMTVRDAKMKTYPKVSNAIAKLDKAGWTVHPTNNASILIADKLGVRDNIVLYRNGSIESQGWDTVAVIEVRQQGPVIPGSPCFANSIAQAIRLAQPSIQ